LSLFPATLVAVFTSVDEPVAENGDYSPKTATNCHVFGNYSRPFRSPFSISVDEALAY